MDSTMIYFHVKKTGNKSVDPVKNLLEVPFLKLEQLQFNLENIIGI